MIVAQLDAILLCQYCHIFYSYRPDDESTLQKKTRATLSHQIRFLWFHHHLHAVHFRLLVSDSVTVVSCYFRSWIWNWANGDPSLDSIIISAFSQSFPTYFRSFLVHFRSFSISFARWTAAYIWRLPSNLLLYIYFPSSFHFGFSERMRIQHRCQILVHYYFYFFFKKKKNGNTCSCVVLPLKNSENYLKT